MLDTQILFLVFNRPNTTSIVFDEIRKVKPKRLYVAADGSRPNKEGESELVEQVREIATNVDWPCMVKTLFLSIPWMENCCTFCSKFDGRAL